MPDSDVENTDLSINDESAGDGSHLSITPPSAKKQKKISAVKKTSGEPLQQIDNEMCGSEGVSKARPKKHLSATEQYQKVSLFKGKRFLKQHFANFRCLAHAIRAYTEATGYIHWFGGKDREADVGLQLRD